MQSLQSVIASSSSEVIEVQSISLCSAHKSNEKEYMQKQYRVEAQLH